MSAEPPQLPPKPDVALALLQTAASVFVHLDPRGADVLVPAWFKKQPQLVLQIGLNMTVPIPDLDVTGEGITCTLSFNRSPQFCRLPWASIYGLVGEDGRGMIWPDSVPKEVAASADGRAQAAQAEKARRGKLRLASEAGGAGETGGGGGAVVSDEASAKKAKGDSGAALAGKGDAQASAAPGTSRKGKKKGEGRAPAKKAGAVSAATSAGRKTNEARTEAAGRPKAERSAKTAEPGLASKARDRAKTPSVRPPAGAVIEPPRNPPGGAPAAPAGKARRELPPYLRIVK